MSASRVERHLQATSVTVTSMAGAGTDTEKKPVLEMVSLTMIFPCDIKLDLVHLILVFLTPCRKESKNTIS